jgi:hypothetical protein
MVIQFPTPVKLASITGQHNTPHGYSVSHTSETGQHNTPHGYSVSHTSETEQYNMSVKLTTMPKL